METKALHPDFGVEILGVDPSVPLSSDEQALYRRIFETHHLVLFRTEGLSPEDQLRIIGYLGRPKLSRHQRYAEPVSNIGASLIASVPLLFHSDRAFCGDPEAGLALYAEEIEGPVPPTLFVSAAAAWERLPPARRLALERMRLVQMIEMSEHSEYGRVRASALPSDASPELYPRAEHPVIKALPGGRGAAVFANENMTSHVIGLPQAESEALLQDIFSDLYDAARVYRHDWRRGDLLIWNNIALQHARPAERGPSRRRLRRMLLDTLYPAFPGDAAPARDGRKA